MALADPHNPFSRRDFFAAKALYKSPVRGCPPEVISERSTDMVKKFGAKLLFLRENISFLIFCFNYPKKSKHKELMR